MLDGGSGGEERDELYGYSYRPLFLGKDLVGERILGGWWWMIERFLIAVC